MWQDLFAALALVLIIEGMFPFLNPTRFKKYLAAMMQAPESQLRSMGLASMVIGVVLLYVVR
ncbi:MAG: DUF2065 domain-containing protein [Pseudomonadota bacterium]